MLLGLDQDTERTADDILAFIEASKIPMLPINLLYALPMTPLWRRLELLSRDMSLLPATPETPWWAQSDALP